MSEKSSNLPYRINNIQNVLSIIFQINYVTLHQDCICLLHRDEYNYLSTYTLSAANSKSDRIVHYIHAIIITA